MPRFLQALRSIAAGRAAKSVVEEDPPTALSAAVGLLRDVASTVGEYLPPSLKSQLTSLLGGKSQSELAFLGSLLVALLLFGIVLPACEALLFGGPCDDEEEEGPFTPRVFKLGVQDADAETCDSSTRSRRSCGSLGTIEESEEEHEEEEEDKLEGRKLFAEEEESVVDKANDTAGKKAVAARTRAFYDRVAKRGQSMTKKLTSRDRSWRRSQ